MSASKRTKKLPPRRRKKVADDRESAAVDQPDPDQDDETRLRWLASFVEPGQIRQARQQGIAEAQREFRQSKDYVKLVKKHGLAAAERLLQNVANELPLG